MDDEEHKRFDRELDQDPSKGPVQHGMRDLMRLFGGPAGQPSFGQPPARDRQSGPIPKRVR